MAATFGSLNLEELGTVGEPDVQYARFETEVAEPRGYDGGVLANFRRGATTIKFNLALTGTNTEIINKMNALADELSKGQQELVLPNMTAGFHFDASANCALQPAQYIDGFVLPLEFVVPYGLAIKKFEASIREGAVTIDGTFANSYPTISFVTNRDIDVISASGTDIIADFGMYNIISTPSFSKYISIIREESRPVRHLTIPAGTRFTLDTEDGKITTDDTSGLNYSTEWDVIKDFFIPSTGCRISFSNGAAYIRREDTEEATVSCKELSVW